MLLMAAKNDSRNFPGLIFASDLGEKKGLAISWSAHLSTIMKKIWCGMATFDLYQDKMYPISSDLSDIGRKNKRRSFLSEFRKKNAIAELAKL